MIADDLEEEIADRVNALSAEYVGRALMCKSTYKDFNWIEANTFLCDYLNHMKMYLKYKRILKDKSKRDDFGPMFTFTYQEYMHHRRTKNELRVKMREFGIDFEQYHNSVHLKY